MAAFCACLTLAACLGAVDQVRVASYNVENYLLKPVGSRPAKSASGRAAIRANLRLIDADVVALQEMGGREAVVELRESLRKEGLVYPHWEWITAFDTNIQVAVLSRFPFCARTPHTNDTYLLMGRRFRSSRGILEVDIEVTPEYRFTLMTTHLKSRRRVGYADQAQMRLQEALLIRRLVDKRLKENPRQNLVVLGDFNDVKSSPPMRALIGRGTRALVDTRPAERNGDSHPATNPRHDPRRITWTYYYGRDDAYDRIDYILISRGMAREWIPEDSYVQSVPDWGLASDHRALMVTFRTRDL